MLRGVLRCSGENIRTRASAANSLGQNRAAPLDRDSGLFSLIAISSQMIYHTVPWDGERVKILKRKKFYQDGIRFECQGCGACCLGRGEYGYVYITAGDRKRISDYLGISTLEFSRRYSARTGNRLHLRDPEKNCLFLKESGCTIYAVRPLQCRTWPFWPENMSRKVWERDIAVWCQGIGKGKLYPADEIEDILKRDEELPG